MGWGFLIYSSAIVHLPHIHQLLSPTDGDLLRVGLVRERLVRRLDRVHGVLGPRHTRSHVVDTRRSTHFKDAVGDAESEAWEKFC